MIPIPYSGFGNETAVLDNYTPEVVDVKEVKAVPRKSTLGQITRLPLIKLRKRGTIIRPISLPISLQHGTSDVQTRAAPCSCHKRCNLEHHSPRPRIFCTRASHAVLHFSASAFVESVGPPVAEVAVVDVL